MNHTARPGPVRAAGLADVFFKHLFSMVSLVSVLALAAILFFVFFQGAMPFVKADAPGIRLVVQRIDEITVNGAVYGDIEGFIYLPPGTDYLSLSFGGEDDRQTVEAAIDKTETDPAKMARFGPLGEAELTYPEAWVYTLSWPAAIKALEPRIHILLPEAPYSFWAFISGMEWRPVPDKVFGVFPMIAGTVLAALGAILLGVPAALLCAVFMAEFLPERAAAFARAGIELLAGIPSVVYGFFGLMVIVPAIKKTFSVPSGNTLLAAILVLALMILPTVITIAEISLRAVPRANREASLSLGAGKMQTAWRVVLPHARSGVIAGVILGVSRAVGETMALILVAGNSPQLVTSPLESIRTLTATIAMEMGYASGRHSEMLFSIGVVLFAMILLLNSMILWMRRKTEAG